MLPWFGLQCVNLAFSGHTHLLFMVTQGHRRDFESGPAERSAKGTTGGEHERGGPPPRKFLKF